ncbi:Holliday junction branch migration protein RuvA, partial [bacterium]|nr:Holliday junction branch migration protein RuvA [bacterium]
FLNGRLCEASDEWVVIDAGGVGYQVFVPQTVIADLPAQGEPMKVYTYHYIREDQQSLYGFLTAEDRRLFGTLISVSGVGPKVGIKFFSTFAAGQLVGAIVHEDIAQLTSVPGVGKKLAERIVIELKDKLPKSHAVSMAGAMGAKARGKVLGALGDDLMTALRQLGYGAEEVKRALAKAGDQLDESMALEAALKVVFRHLVN